MNYLNDDGFSKWAAEIPVDPTTGAAKIERRGGKTPPPLSFFKVPDRDQGAVAIRLVGTPILIWQHDLGAPRIQDVDGKYQKQLEHINRGMPVICRKQTFNESCPICDVIDKYDYLKATPKESHLHHHAMAWRLLQITDNEKTWERSCQYIFDMIAVDVARRKVASGTAAGDPDGYKFDHIRMTQKQFDKIMIHTRSIYDQMSKEYTANPQGEIPKIELLWDLKVGRVLVVSREQGQGFADPIEYEVMGSVKLAGREAYRYEARTKADGILKEWLKFPDRIGGVVKEDGEDDLTYQIRRRKIAYELLYYPVELEEYNNFANQLEEFFETAVARHTKKSNAGAEVPWEKESAPKQADKKSTPTSKAAAPSQSTAKRAPWEEDDDDTSDGPEMDYGLEDTDELV